MTRQADLPAGEAAAVVDPAVGLVRRIAHDLATPIGALTIAIELDPATDPVVREAVGQLEALISAYRSLFGAPADAPFDFATLAPLLGGISLLSEAAFDFQTARALGALAIDAAPLLPGRGSITLFRADGRPAVGLEGRVRPPGPALAAVLAGAPATEPAVVGAALAVRLLGPFRVETGTDRLDLVATPPR